MKTKLFCLCLIAFITFADRGYSQCSTSYPAQGTCTGCTSSPTGTITITSNNTKFCATGTSTVTEFYINGNDDTIYVCGNITVNSWTGYGHNPVIVINSGHTLTIANALNNYANTKFVNYGTFNVSSGWNNFTDIIITIGNSARTNIAGDLTLNGGVLYLEGGTTSVGGKTTFNSGTGGTCLKSNAILNTTDITNNATNMVVVAPSSTACIGYTGLATIYNTLTSSILNVHRGLSASGTAASDPAWGPHTTVSSMSCNILLPMVMGDFSLTNSGTKVIVNWSTYSEQNSNQFEIQRSNDAINFFTIGTISASGNSSSTKQYSFTDHYPTIGNDYYRIKLLSDDGNPSYSVIKQIEITPPTEMKVIVNNSQNNIKVGMPENSSQSTLRLLDMQGRIIKTVTNAIQQEFMTIETSNVLSGVYIVELISQNKHQAKQVFLSAGK